MNLGRAVRRGFRFVVHNWPLKVGAIILATILYAGLVASQDSSTFAGPVAVTPVNQPPDTVVINQLRDVDQIRYYAPVGVPRPVPGDFKATVDLENIDPDAVPVNVPIRVIPVDPRITVIDVTPRTAQVVLDKSVSKVVPVRLSRPAAPAGVDVGEPTFEPQQVTVKGPSTAVTRIVEAVVIVAIDPNGIDVNREVEAQPVDANGVAVTGVDVEPRTVHVQIPLFTNKQTRTLPVHPVVTGTPAPGFRVSAIEVDPLAVTVEGDADQLGALVQVDTAPVTIFGATANVNQAAELALPSGVVATGIERVTVRITITPVTETRTYTAGLRLDGRRDGVRLRDQHGIGAAHPLRLGGRSRSPLGRAPRGRAQRLDPRARHACRAGRAGRADRRHGCGHLARDRDRDRDQQGARSARRLDGWVEPAILSEPRRSADDRALTRRAAAIPEGAS